MLGNIMDVSGGGAKRCRQRIKRARACATKGDAGAESQIVP